MRRYKFDAVTNFIMDWLEGYVAWHNPDMICYKFKNENVPDSLKVIYYPKTKSWNLVHKFEVTGKKKPYKFQAHEDTIGQSIELIAQDEAFFNKENIDSDDENRKQEWNDNTEFIEKLFNTIDFLQKMFKERIENEYSYTGEK